jgi:class 3 adenylate cyclase/tetratricopeptide (TPR) repeat protein
MPVCSACGYESAVEFRFCPECGAAASFADDEHRKVVTVVFCDLAGSTALGESIDPEALRELLARYFARMKEIVERHGGTVEKFIGDAVMAVFGVPAVHEDDALRALRAAVEMRDAFPELELAGRIGVNTGEVITGTAERLATGDAVNVAARLEQAAPTGEILVGEPTVRLVGDSAEAVPVDPLTLKGKSEPVPAWKLVSVSAEAPTRRLDTPILGREDELHALADAWRRAQTERTCTLVTVVGSAGVGKSRLVAEFLDRAGDQTALRARCLSYGDGITYWPVAEILTRVRPRLDELDPSAKAALESVLLGEGGVPTDEIAWAFRKLLEALADERPLIAVFDDIQWGEEAFLDLLEHVSVMAVGSPILLCCMARPELLERRPGWGGVMRLQPLELDAAEQLITSRLGEELDPDLRERIVAAAGGNPLFVEEMASMVAASGGRDVVVPPTIQALLAARLDQLEASERSVLECASVEGEIFHRGSVQALAPEESQLATRLTALVRKELVRPDRAQLPSEDGFRFRHLLIRDAAYDSLPRRTRAALHERFADWLEESGEGLVELDEIVGYHLEQAHRFREDLGVTDIALGTRAGERLAAAGETAFGRADVPAAAALLGRARELLPADHPTARRLLPDLATSLGELAQAERAVEILSEAVESARAAHDELTEWRSQAARLWIVNNGAFGVPADEIERGAKEAIDVLTRLGDDRGLARAWRTYADVSNERGNGAQWLEGVTRAAEHARRAGDLQEQRTALWLVGGALFFGPTPVPAATRRCEELLASVSGSPPAEAPLLRGLAACHAQQGRFDQARQLLGRVREIVGDRGGILFTGVAFVSAPVELLAGDPASAEREARGPFELMRDAGYVGRAGGLAQILARAVLEQGRLDEAEELASFGLDENPDEASAFPSRGIQGVILARRGELAAAKDAVRDALAHAVGTDFLNYRGQTELDAAEIFERAGDAVEAKAAARRACDLFARKQNIVMLERARARLDAVGSA